MDKYFKNNNDNVDYFFSSEYHINNQRNDKLYDNTNEQNPPEEEVQNENKFVIWENE